ncbi:RelA/SpoT family protein [Eggerthia catenaformis OT 569 = DSM 20559]|uniref:GTP diphosphokinase n=1 Tax=Eggerthia catenaformis OT 569 = DSM 20559 TaxID=999415 RepID=M2Q1R2_9FIRM|nr:bifunctional (p)ppGpp synthetase/guanosine-3',5'-bis(diphosphate) 3'-pyrophosphohydrolase [Eggerthia catenaformis]EMD16855.1 RelA/SpoT family protein [Eggerthia catenaformis OT 569 = DSM 20559]
MDTIKGAHDQVSYEDVLMLAKQYITNKDDLDLMRGAYDFIMIKHATQKRRSGEPYTVHLIWVAYILATLQTGPKTIAAGFLHDVMEDCNVPHDEMVERFGEEITTLVEGVTKINKMPYMEESEIYAENHRKIYIAMAKDIRVILIKLADRLHNMRTLQFMPSEKQQRISRETLEVYAPIAHRLGINDIRIELEDLCLSYLDPKAYKEIADLLEQKRSERKEAVDHMRESVEKLLQEHHIEYRIKGRAKHIYSIYKKMVIKHKRFDELYDLNALRIILKNKVECYEVLGIIHEKYRPLPGRFKDYIAMPKPNMYQSLHTAVIGEGGQIFEIQIRTEEMDELAERGVASHWRYKEGSKYSAKEEQREIGEKLQWLSDFITISDEVKDEKAQEYYDTLKRDIFEANVYILTPQGKIVELPNGSTPIDFAYRIHTEVGHHATGAIVNNVMVPIDTKLKTGDVCKILTQNNAHPSEDWLKFVRTGSARNKIKAYLTKKENENNKEIIEEGYRILKAEVTRRSLDEKVYLDSEVYKPFFNTLGVKNFDEILMVIGKKSATPSALLDKVIPQKKSIFDNLSKMLKKNNNAIAHQNKKKSIGISVKNVSGLKMSISKCCSPIPGDQVAGFVSKGQGIKVHRIDCPNIVNADPARLIDVYWDYTNLDNKRYTVDLQILGLDRPNLLNDVVTILGTSNVSILNINASVNDLDADIKVSVSVENAEILQVTIDNLNKIQGISNVKRVIH